MGHPREWAFPLSFVVDMDFCEALAGFHECAEDINIFHHRGRRGHRGFCVVILRPAFFAGRRIYGLVSIIGAAGGVHRVGTTDLEI